VLRVINLNAAIVQRLVVAVRKNMRQWWLIICTSFQAQSIHSAPDLSHARIVSNERSPTLAALALLEGVQGHIVDFPYDFLSHEYLAPTIGTKEAWVPMRTFT
jgi:hypothetical protein